jgi:hypothetical protein
MNRNDLLALLRNHTPQFQRIGIFSIGLTTAATALLLWIAGQRPPHPELYSIYYLGMVITVVQLTLSFYVWRYLPRRIPRPVSSAGVIAGYRLTMILALSLCIGIALFGGISSVTTGYPLAGAVISGLAIGAMVIHLPSEKRYSDFVSGLSD